jgi:hypothetical protein
MHSRGTRLLTAVVTLALPMAAAQQPQPPAPGPAIQGPLPADDVVRTLVGQLELERYKATIKGLTQFGDRREGTERNRRAVDWIEAQLKSYGCDTARLTYDPNMPREGQQAGGGGRGGAGHGGGQGRGATPPRTPAGTPDDPVRRGAGGKSFGGRPA